MATSFDAGVGTFAGAPILGAPTPGAADVAVIGVPYDGGAGYRPGARFGPRAIRAASVRLPFFAPGPATGGASGATGKGYWDVETGRRRLSGVTLVDAGDIPAAYLDWNETARLTRERVQSVAAAGLLPVVLGGDHSVSLPVFEGLVAGLKGVAVIHFDAHLDYRDQAGGGGHGHASVIRRIGEHPAAGPIVSIGLRGLRASEADCAAAAARGNLILTAEDARRLPARPADLAGVLPEAAAAFVTIDIDALDPAVAPGTGTPEFDGLSYRQLRDLLGAVARRYGRGILGFDLVEVNPYLDHAEITAAAAARTIVEFLAGIFDAGEERRPERRPDRHPRRLPPGG
jgi:agmatinase